MVSMCLRRGIGGGVHRSSGGKDGDGDGEVSVPMKMSSLQKDVMSWGGLIMLCALSTCSTQFVLCHLLPLLHFPIKMFSHMFHKLDGGTM